MDGMQVRVAGAVLPGNGISAALDKEEIDQPPGGILPDIPMDIEGVSLDAPGFQIVLAGRAERGEIGGPEGADAGFFRLDLARERNGSGGGWRNSYRFSKGFYRCASL